MAVFAADAVLVIVALLLSWLAYAVCHHLVVPLTVRLTEKTQVEWDDVLLNEHTLGKACMHDSACNSGVDVHSPHLLPLPYGGDNT